MVKKKDRQIDGRTDGRTGGRTDRHIQMSYVTNTFLPDYIPYWDLNSRVICTDQLDPDPVVNVKVSKLSYLSYMMMMIDVLRPRLCTW